MAEVRSPVALDTECFCPSNERWGYIGNDHRRESAIILYDPIQSLLRADEIEIGRERYHIYCQPLDIVGIKATTFFIVVISRGTRRGMFNSATLMKQMQAMQQAERGSMNKSIVFASANHDIRSALATIVGLIEFCLTEVSPNSNLDLHWIFLMIEVMYYDCEMKYTVSFLTNCVITLILFVGCERISELLNPVLDTSRIKASKMQLHEEVFDQSNRGSSELHISKGVGKMNRCRADHCDSSVLKSPLVKGDRGKLKHVLTNLLSNALKFKSEVHVVLYAWERKPNPDTSLLSPKYNGIWKRISHLVYNNTGQDYNETLHTFECNENSLELVDEVNHTGKGIPKEKRDSIFENFVQVKETTLGQGGTRLGLGIVQSLVRLVGGEISILDKEINEKGTCLSFNIFLFQS
ncbi:histidine kinase CKI1-like [Papaver somniferum]|uniref:histidine kinase CKI1-like n=1 Tax=Papaver somniferum TaxID=3469 RepID=UPI000E6FFE19|nr:histidine kinase CKI1-like [Papaver somniferum]